MTLSRTHFGLVKRLFELEVPEIQDGTVVIKGIAREAGSRTKMAVESRDENVDPVGACIGNRGGRISSILNELHGEKQRAAGGICFGGALAGIREKRYHGRRTKLPCHCRS